jgi:hypothetical protein
MPLPIQEAIRDLTGDLLGRGTAVDKVRQPLEPDEVAVVAGYRDGEGVLQAVVAVDRQLVPILGGSLVMIPEVVIKEHLKKQEMPDNLVENFWEVANIMASLLNRTGGAHVALRDREMGTEVGEEIRALLAAPKRQRWFAITVQGYGTGRIGFAAAT